MGLFDWGNTVGVAPLSGGGNRSVVLTWGSVQSTYRALQERAVILDGVGLGLLLYLFGQWFKEIYSESIQIYFS